MTLGQLAGTVTFEEATKDPIAGVPRRCCAVMFPTSGPPSRVPHHRRRPVHLVHVSDHQQPGCQSTSVADSVLELCDGVDLLIHDVEHTDPEFAQKFDWGHCTTDYAVEAAVQCERSAWRCTTTTRAIRS